MLWPATSFVSTGDATAATRNIARLIVDYTLQCRYSVDDKQKMKGDRMTLNLCMHRSGLSVDALLASDNDDGRQIQ